MASDADAVVVGAGPNGLVAANLLADRGWDVVVYEAAPDPGGAVRSAELMERGFVNDLFSAFYPLAAASPVVRGLRLEEHGLTWKYAPIVLAHPAADGTCPVLTTELDHTAASLDAFCGGDGDAWRELHRRWERLRPGLIEGLFAPMPPVKASVQLALAARRDALRLARFALLPVRQMTHEYFGSDPAQRLVAGCALHADLAPGQVLSGFFGWFLCMLGQDYGWPVPEGGAAALTRALVARLEARGGRLVCNAPVERVVVRDGRAVGVAIDGQQVLARRAVLADVDAPNLFTKLVGLEHLPSQFADDLRRFVWDQSVFKVDWNLDSAIPWSAPEARRAGTLHIVDSIDELTRSRAQIEQRLVPDEPFLIVGQQSVADPTRTPPGRETAWAYSHLPREIKGDAADTLPPLSDPKWREAFADRMQHRIERLAPGFTSLVRGRHILAPNDLQDRDSNLVGGGINGGTAQLFQQFVFRPTPGFGRPETPIRRLFLASASAHPGGGVHGACGSNAARAAIAHDRLDFARRSRSSPTGAGRRERQ
ncbi:MAG TPA: NAD(P)/FAD-dependent oxidoreductase [Acidimicrobiia bacterium]